MTQNNPFRAGLSESQMWSQYNAVCKRLERSQNGRLNLAYKEWCNLVRMESEMRRYLNAQIWGEDEPLNLPKTEEEKLSRIQAMSREERYLILLCDFQKHFRSVIALEKELFKSERKQLKSCDKTWVFEKELWTLRNLGWKRAFILEKFGVDLNEAKNLCIRLRK